MIYPKKIKSKVSNKLKNNMKYIKEHSHRYLKAFSSFASFIMFLEQYFHF